MTPEKCLDSKQQAMAGYLDPGPNHLNCAQAVLTGGLLVLDVDRKLVNLANYFGGGMARIGQACGALTGAAIALGLRDFNANGSVPRNVGFDPLQKLMRDFEQEFGALTCKDLVGCDISTAEGFRAAKKKKCLERCPTFVQWTIDRLGEILCDQAARQ